MPTIQCTFKQVTNATEVAGFLYMNQQFHRFFFKNLETGFLEPISDFETFTKVIAYNLDIYEQVQ